MRTALLLMALLSSACGGRGYEHWEGTHAGTQSGTPFTNDFSLQLWEQEDGSLKGYAMSIYDADRPFAVMDVTAERTDDGLEVTLDQNSRCAATFETTLSEEGDELDGTLSGTTVDQCGTTYDCSTFHDQPDLPLSIACGAYSATLSLKRVQ